MKYSSLDESLLRDIYSITSLSTLSKLKNCSILITGASGWFGKWLLQFILFLNRNYSFDIKVIAVTRDLARIKLESPFLISEKIKWIEANVTELSQELLAEAKIDYVIHGASSTNKSGWKDTPIALAKEIILGTEKALEIAKHFPGCKVLFLSSGAVYGKIQCEKVAEDYQGRIDDQAGDSFYCLGKKISELMCSDYQQRYGITINTARCFAFIGSYIPSYFAISEFIEKAKNNHPIIINSPHTVRSYMDMRDLISWLLVLLTAGDSGVYNVGSDVGYSMIDLAQVVVKILQSSAEINIQKDGFGKLMRTEYVPSIKKIVDKFDLKSKYNISDSVSTYSKIL